MIDIPTARAKQQALFYMDRMMGSIERSFAPALRRALRTQYKAVADFVLMGSYDYNHALQITTVGLEAVFKKYYKRIYFLFGNIIFNRLKDKDKSTLEYSVKQTESTLMDEYLANMDWWARTHMAEQIVKLHITTKKKIAKIIEEGILEGQTNRELAQAIMKTDKELNAIRAVRIARTETHTVANMSTSSAMQVTRLKYTKQWISALDARTRKGKFNHVAANMEEVAKDEYYVRTGEALFFPGDPNGSAGNIINCRCVEIYNTIRE